MMSNNKGLVKSLYLKSLLKTLSFPIEIQLLLHKRKQKNLSCARERRKRKSNASQKRQKSREGPIEMMTWTFSLPITKKNLPVCNLKNLKDNKFTLKESKTCSLTF
jgi:hypothetical protein